VLRVDMATDDSTAAIYAVISHPFWFALAAIVMFIPIWLIVRWAYVDQLREAKKYRDRIRKDRQRFKCLKDKLKFENQKKEHKIAVLENEKALLSPAGQNALAELADSQERTDQTLDELHYDRVETDLDAGSASSVTTK